jgi:hypothetical protein
MDRDEALNLLKEISGHRAEVGHHRFAGTL